MIEVLFLALVLFVLAWVAWTYLPHPLGLIVAVVLGLLGLWLIVDAVADEDVDRDRDSVQVIPLRL